MNDINNNISGKNEYEDYYDEEGESGESDNEQQPPDFQKIFEQNKKKENGLEILKNSYAASAIQKDVSKKEKV